MLIQGEDKMKWIKENWFKTSLLILIMAVIVLEVINTSLWFSVPFATLWICLTIVGEDVYKKMKMMIDNFINTSLLAKRKMP